MKAIKKLTGETAIYGMPSIVGRFLNWWLNPYWTYIFLDQAQMGRIINVYAYVAFAMVILTYGMETGYFRFATKESNPQKVFSTSIISFLITSVSFLFAIIVFRHDLAVWMDLTQNPEFITIMGITVALDVFTTLPFAKLRLNKKPVKFAVIKFINIGCNIGFNLLFLTVFPYLAKIYPGEVMDFLYKPEFGIGYVFLANMLATIVTLIQLLPEFTFQHNFDWKLLKRMLSYSFPILIVGVTGMINQNIDKILLPLLLSENMEPMKQLGIYGACFKMAVLLNMFVQAFRFAFEPFFFSQKSNEETKTIYIVVMKYFIIIGLVMFLGLSTYVDILKRLISSAYREGVAVIPIALMANLFMGIYFNLSLWYKITDKTRYGAYQGIIGSIVTVAINFMLVPYIGYYASVIAILVCFVVMTVISYVSGMKHYPVNYDLKNFFFYLFLSILLFGIYWIVRTDNAPNYWLATLVNIIFIGTIFWREKKEILLIIKS